MSFDIKSTKHGFENTCWHREASKCVLKVEPGKLDIKKCKPGILFICLPTVSLLKLAIMTYFSTFVLIQRH